MGILLGLPLRLLGLLIGLLRFLLPIALIALAVWLWRRRKRTSAGAADTKRDGPHFRGPVYTVDYEDVKDAHERDGD